MLARWGRIAIHQAQYLLALALNATLAIMRTLLEHHCAAFVHQALLTHTLAQHPLTFASLVFQALMQKLLGQCHARNALVASTPPPLATQKAPPALNVHFLPLLFLLGHLTFFSALLLPLAVPQI